MTDEPQQESLIPADIRAMSDNDVIAEHVKLSDHIAAQTKAFNEYLKPARERQDWLEKQLFGKLVEMNRGKPEGKRANMALDSGTAYLSTIVTPKVVDKEKYLDFLLENWDQWGGMLQIGNPQKDAFKEYIDRFGQNPPHVETSTFVKVNIRRS